jgi:hypothetical protein
LGKAPPIEHAYGDDVSPRPLREAAMALRPTADRLSGEEVRALKFAAHRQLARWAKNSGLSPRQQAQRGALAGAVRILQDTAFAHGCELRVPNAEKNDDA